jgi:hypothetical protein
VKISGLRGCSPESLDVSELEVWSGDSYFKLGLWGFPCNTGPITGTQQPAFAEFFENKGQDEDCDWAACESHFFIKSVAFRSGMVL